MKTMLKILKMMRDTLRQYANIISHIGTKMGFKITIHGIYTQGHILGLNYHK